MVLVLLLLLMVECPVCVANHGRSELPFASKRNAGAYLMEPQPDFMYPHQTPALGAATYLAGMQRCSTT